MATDSFYILALYRFVEDHIDSEHLQILRDEIECFLRPKEARGTILLATEGINGTVCFPNKHKEEIMEYLLSKFPSLQTRLSYHPTENVFFRLKVKIKSEIVTLGKGNINPNEKVGTYVTSCSEWDRLLEDPDCWVIDTRNEYEYRVGSFAGAENPHTENFVDFPTWFEKAWEKKQKTCSKIAMFCTGGIRCEKATSYCMDLIDNSDETPEVLHLKGGILSYLDQTPPEKSMFHGECYVFDRRVAVSHGLKPSTTFQQCHACRSPLTPEDRRHEHYDEGISCHLCYESRENQRERYKARQTQMKLSPTHLHDAKTAKLLLCDKDETSTYLKDSNKSCGDK